MTIPFYPEIINNKNYKQPFDINDEKNFIGFITPEGLLLGGNEFQAAHIANMPMTLFDFIEFKASSLTNKELLNYLDEQRKKSLDSHKKKAKKYPLRNFHIEHELFSFRIFDYFFKYYKQFGHLNSEFMKKYLDFDNQLYADYAVQLFGYDKVERLPKTITTSRINIYEHFFNYLLMDFTIVQLPAVGFDSSIGDFNYIYPNPFIQSASEQEHEEQLMLIKRSTPLNERGIFLKSNSIIT
jgi:hypothetical protein